MQGVIPSPLYFFVFRGVEVEKGFCLSSCYLLKQRIYLADSFFFRNFAKNIVHRVHRIHRMILSLPCFLWTKNGDDGIEKETGVYSRTLLQ